MTSMINSYHRPDGVVGCGFFGEFGGLWQHSIAWPDQPSARMRFEDLEERQIEIKNLAVFSHDGRDLVRMFAGRDLIDMANAPCGDYRFSKSDVQKVNANKNGDSMIVEDVYVGPPVVADPPAPEDAAPFDPSASEAENIRRAIAADPDATNRDIITLLNSHGVNVSSSQISRERRAIAAVAEAETAASEEPASEEGEAEE